MNSCQLVGRMVADPEIKYTNDGKSIAKFRIAVDRQFKKEGQPDADFLNCNAFGKTAEFIEKYFHKGMKIGLVGRIQTGSYEKDGRTYYTTDIIADNVEFVESKQSSQEQAQEQPKTQQKPKQTQGANDGFMNLPDEIGDELPFS